MHYYWEIPKPGLGYCAKCTITGRFQSQAWAAGLERDGEMVDLEEVEAFRWERQHERAEAAKVARALRGPSREATPPGGRTPGGRYADPAVRKDELQAALTAYSKEQASRKARMYARHHHGQWKNVNLALGLDVRARKAAPPPPLRSTPRTLSMPGPPPWRC
jgi:hypothetical protein